MPFWYRPREEKKKKKNKSSGVWWLREDEVKMQIDENARG